MLMMAANPANARAITASVAILCRRSSLNTVAVAPAAVEGANGLMPQQRRRNSSLLGHSTLPTHQNINQQRRPPSHESRQLRQFARERQRFKKRHHPNRGNDGDQYSFTDLDDPNRNRRDKNILVIGSSGVLGKTLVSHFGHVRDWNVIGADVLDPAVAADDQKGLRDYVRLPAEGSVADLTGELYRGVSRHLRAAGGNGNDKSNEGKLDAIVCASGGWAGDVDFADMVENRLAESASSELEDLDIEEEYARESAEVCERMMRVNYHPIVAGSQVGRRFMRRGGLFCVIGASAALSPTPGMVGYGSAKSAAHHYLQSWGPTLLEQNDIHSVGILPLMIDTPANRDMLSDNDDGGDERYSKMVKPIHIANEIGEWLKLPRLMPHAGSLVKVIAKNRKDGSGGAAFHLVR